LCKLFTVKVLKNKPQIREVNVLLIGNGFSSSNLPSDKHFFRQLIPQLQNKANITVYSYNENHSREFRQSLNSCDHIIYRDPISSNLLRRGHRADSNDINTPFYPGKNPVFEFIRRIVLHIISIPRIKKIVQNHHVDAIHFMDNFGIAMPLTRILINNVRVYFSAACYDPRGPNLLHDMFLKSSIFHLHGIGVYTQAYLSILKEKGVKAPLNVTRWGVPKKHDNLPIGQKRSVRESLRIQDGALLILWSGFLKQIREKDFYFAINLAEETTKAIKNVHFVFTFKPTSFKEKYLTASSDRIDVISGIDNFIEVLESADLLFSPMTSLNTTIAPPLTWLEAMARGTPIITTPVLGAEEVITHLKTGYILSDDMSLADIAKHALNKNRLQIISENSTAFVQDCYNIENSAKQYLDLWNIDFNMSIDK